MNTQEIKVTNAQTIRIDAKLQDKIVIPSLERQNVLPDESYDGLSKVVVDAISLENKTVKPNRDTQIITPTEALGLSSVTIEPVLLEEQNVVPSKEVQTLKPSDAFIGFSQVIVDKIPNEYIIPEGNLNISSNGEYDVTNNVSVKVNVDKQPNLQDKEARVIAPANVFVHPDEGYDGLAFVNVIATVDAEQLEVTPTKEEQVLTPSEKNYFDSVTVNAIPDNYIEPSGELEITENGNYDITDKESVNVDIQPNVAPKTITSNGTYNASDDGLDGYSSVEVEMSGGSEIEINDASYLFYANARLDQLETLLSLLKGVTTTTNMFYGCTNLTELDVSKIDTSNVTNMASTFYQCMSLLNLDLSKWNTSQVTNMSQMFAHCQKLETVNLTGFNTSNVTNMMNMFASCQSLLSLDLTGFDTSKVTNISGIFQSCSKMTSLNIGSFDMSKVNTTGSSIFTTCSKLKDLVFGINLGKGYTRTSANYSSYSVNLSSSTLLTHDSLMSVINNLYDLNLTYNTANGGTLYTQQLVLGSTNLAKLTDEEKAIATNKGWTLS